MRNGDHVEPGGEWDAMGPFDGGWIVWHDLEMAIAVADDSSVGSGVDHDFVPQEEMLRGVVFESLVQKTVAVYERVVMAPRDAKNVDLIDVTLEQERGLDALCGLWL